MNPSHSRPAWRAMVPPLGEAAAEVTPRLTRDRIDASGAFAAPSDVDLEAAQAVVSRQPWTRPHLVFVRDKAVLFDRERQAFVMYGVQRRTWVALGDPVGPDDRAAPLVRRFIALCEQSGGVPVFYQVRPDHLEVYRNLGLRVLKLGEEGRVDLGEFALAGRRWGKVRQNLNRLKRAGVTFRVVPSAEAPALIGRLQRVSDDWLDARRGGEKGFSLGPFRPDYVTRFDIAVMEKDGEILAFANLWAAAEEIATDLIRYRRHAPPETMEALLVQAMAWGKARGFGWFSLGMTPLAGVDATSTASAWGRIGAFIYTHGEPLYHFQGLRTFKQKFQPRWEPRYVACGDGGSLLRLAVDVAALIAGGYRKLIWK